MSRRSVITLICMLCAALATAALLRRPARMPHAGRPAAGTERFEPVAVARMSVTMAPLSGRVASSHGEPIEGAAVCADCARRSCKRLCTSSDSNGAFQLMLSAGTEYVLSASAQCYAPTAARGSSQPVSIVAGHGPSATASARFVLAPQGEQVRGTVLDGIGGTISHASVTAASATGAKSSALTNDEGAFALCLPSGPGEVYASADGYAPQSQSIVAPRMDVRLVLLPPSTIVGEVVDDSADSAPVAGVPVVATSTGASFPVQASCISDPRGAFHFDHLPPGDYQLTAASPSWANVKPQAVAVGVAEEAKVVLPVTRAVVVNGSILRAGRPCRDASLTLTGSVLRTAIAGADGHVELQGVAPGRYIASVLCADAIALEEVLDVAADQPLNRVWDLAAGMQVTGVVVDATDRPRAGVAVEVVTVGPRQDQVSTCVSDDRGDFVCGGLSPGDYACQATDASGRSRTEPAVVHIDSTPIAPLRLRLSPGGTLRVSVYAKDGTRSSDVGVSARANDGALHLASLAGGGTYVVDDLPLGRYEVRADALASSQHDSKNVELQRHGQVAEVELKLDEGHLHIAGLVSDADGNAVPDATVKLRSAELAFSPGAGATAITDARGAFTIGDLSSGQYQIVIEHPLYSAFDEIVAAGEDNLRARLRMQGSLSGVVRDAKGAPVDRFFLVAEDDERATSQHVVDAHGRWHLDRLSAGHWRVGVWSAAGYALREVDLQPDNPLAELTLIAGSVDRTAAERALRFPLEQVPSP